jgi:hypothetical protein
VAEVDIMEYFHASFPGKTYATLHLDGRKNLSKNNIAFESPQGPSGWHTWAVEISPAGATGSKVKNGAVLTTGCVIAVVINDWISATVSARFHNATSSIVPCSQWLAAARWIPPIETVSS